MAPWPESMPVTALKLETKIEKWPFVTPFRITGYVWEAIEVLYVQLTRDGHVARGEGAGVYYRDDKPAAMLAQIESSRAAIEAGITREAAQKLLPPGGARNALDCALWDLEAKVSGKPAWQIAGLEKPHGLLTTMTCGADEPAKMAAKARDEYRQAKAIKLKLTGEPSDGDRVRAVREVRPDVWLGVDANQGFTRESLEKLMPTLVDTGVKLIEQPFRIGQDALLDGFKSPIPVAADESVQTLADVRALVGRYNVMNIKLDKCGGLTEGLAMARLARELGLECMVGNMVGTSLSMAPAYLVGQLCSVVDLDGPIFIKGDRELRVRYENGLVTVPEGLWGSP